MSARSTTRSRRSSSCEDEREGAVEVTLPHSLARLPIVWRVRVGDRWGPVGAPISSRPGSVLLTLYLDGWLPRLRVTGSVRFLVDLEPGTLVRIRPFVVGASSPASRL